MNTFNYVEIGVTGTAYRDDNGVLRASSINHYTKETEPTKEECELDVKRLFYCVNLI